MVVVEAPVVMVVLFLYDEHAALQSSPSIGHKCPKAWTEFQHSSITQAENTIAHLYPMVGKQNSTHAWWQAVNPTACRLKIGSSCSKLGTAVQAGKNSNGTVTP